MYSHHFPSTRRKQTEKLSLPGPTCKADHATRGPAVKQVDVINVE